MYKGGNFEFFNRSFHVEFAARNHHRLEYNWKSPRTRNRYNFCTKIIEHNVDNCIFILFFNYAKRKTSCMLFRIFFRSFCTVRSRDTVAFAPSSVTIRVITYFMCDVIKIMTIIINHMDDIFFFSLYV